MYFIVLSSNFRFIRFLPQYGVRCEVVLSEVRYTEIHSFVWQFLQFGVHFRFDALLIHRLLYVYYPLMY